METFDGPGYCLAIRPCGSNDESNSLRTRLLQAATIGYVRFCSGKIRYAHSCIAGPCTNTGGRSTRFTDIIDRKRRQGPAMLLLPV